MIFIGSGVLQLGEMFMIVPTVLMIYMGYRAGRISLPIHRLLIAYGVLVPTAAISAAVGVAVPTFSLTLFIILAGALGGYFATSGAWHDEDVGSGRIAFALALGISLCGIAGFGSANHFAFQGEKFILLLLTLSALGTAAHTAGYQIHRSRIVDE